MNVTKYIISQLTNNYDTSHTLYIDQLLFHFIATKHSSLHLYTALKGIGVSIEASFVYALYDFFVSLNSENATSGIDTALIINHMENPP